MRRLLAVLGLVATFIAVSPGVAQADPSADPCDVQTLAPPRPSAAALDAEFTALVSQIAGMHIINPAITDNGGRMVCAHLDSHSREDTTADLLHDNPTFTPAEAAVDAFLLIGGPAESCTQLCQPTLTGGVDSVA
jgi:hypothetical protein